jgi:hypothetical protein
LTETSGTGTQLAEGAALPKHLRSTFNQSGLCTNQSSFTITIVNDQYNYTCFVIVLLAYELLLYLMAGISPKAEEQILGNTELAAETSINIWNKHYLCLV